MTNDFALLLRSDRFTSSVRNRDSVYNTCFCVKQAVALSRFHAFLRSLFRSNVLLWESPLLLRGITGEAVLEPWAV